jgi:hypothetical protein
MQGEFKPDPELSREIHVSNRVLNMDARIKEIIDYLKNFKGEHPAIDTAIIKLDQI